MFGYIHWHAAEAVADVQLNETEGQTCAVQSCQLQTGSDAVFWCSYAHHQQWHADEARKRRDEGLGGAA